MWEERFLVGVSCLRARACCHCAFFPLPLCQRTLHKHPSTHVRAYRPAEGKEELKSRRRPSSSEYLYVSKKKKKKKRKKKKRANDRHSVHLLGSSSSPPLLLPYSLAIPTLRRVLLSSEAHLWLHIPTGTRGY